MFKKELFSTDVCILPTGTGANKQLPPHSVTPLKVFILFILLAKLFIPFHRVELLLYISPTDRP